MKDYIPFISSLPAYFQKRPTTIRANDKAVTFEEYCEIPALNASVLKCPTPAHMLFSLTEDEDEEEKQHFKIGRLVHLASLEPDRFHDSIAKIPEDAPKKPTKAQINAKKPALETIQSIQFWEHFTTTNAGRTVLKADELDQVEQMRDALLAHHQIRELLQCPGHTEATIEVWDDEMQVMRKMRYDKLPGAGADFLLDVKTTRKELNINALKYEILGMGYHLQARYYMDGLNLASADKRKRFYFPFVRSAPPYIARLVELNVNTPGNDNPLLVARDLLYANEDVARESRLPIGRMPMFIGAAREFLQRVGENHPKPFGAWEGYENENAVLIV